MTLAESVRVGREFAKLSVRELAALSGVAPSTVLRIEEGFENPRADVVERLLPNIGMAVTYTSEQQPAAIRAARAILGNSARIALDAKAAEWAEHWKAARWTKDGEALKPEKIARQAGSLNWLDERPQARAFLPTKSWRELAASLIEADVPFAMTGGPAANCLVPVGQNMEPRFYVEDVETAVGFAGLQPLPEGYFGPRIVLLPFDGIVEREPYRLEEDGLVLANIWQIAIDCYGTTSTKQADALLGLWE
ncbi:MAG: helix-turn-helix transcriptional regulator [Propionibacteriaceae bacterium]|jgi:transcriptional regulator with XRE-family HTH domain|nr:helix-turn-helix transcriptional regulator [Propionibacteriaceae bacterium]